MCYNILYTAYKSGGKKMLIEEIIDARDELVLLKINGEKLNFQKLRSLCKKYNETEDDGRFDISSDDAMWVSVNNYFTNLLKES